MTGTWPLTGRDEELRFIDTAISRAGGVVLAGAAGVGKTRLARETVATAEHRGLTGRWVVGTTSARTLPLGAFAALLGSTGEDPTQPVVAASTALLAGLSPAGAVIGVDDAQLLDELSALLVHHLVLQQSATVVITVRSGEPAPDPITALWKDGHLDRLEIQPLSGAETAALLAAALGGPVDTGVAERMWALTRGNALYLRHLVDGERDAGRLRLIRGMWCWPDPPTLSPGLAELVESRIGELPEPVGDVLDLLALGEPLDAALLGRLCDPDAVERAEARGLITAEPGEDGVPTRLAHPLYGEVRRTRLGRLRARRLRGQLATALAATDDPADALRRAVLTLDSDLPADAGLLAAGAAEAARLVDMRLAERLAGGSVAAGGGFEPAMVLVWALGWQGHGEESQAVLATLVGTETDDLQRARLAVARAGNLYWPLGRPDQAEALVTEAQQGLADERLAVPLAALQTAFHAWQTRHAQAERTGHAVLTAKDVPPGAVLLASYGLVISLGARGQLAQLGPITARAYAAAGESFEAAQVAPCVAARQLVALRLAGELEQGERLAAELAARYSRAPGIQPLFGAAWLGYSALGAGRVATAAGLLRQAVVGMPFAPNPEHGNTLLWLAEAFAKSGAVAPARAAVADWVDQRLPGMGYLGPEVLLVQAWIAAAEGAVSEAIRLARDSAAHAAGLGQSAHEVLALHAATCFGDRDTAARLAELATQVDGPRAAAAAAQAVALAEDDGAGLHAASLRLEHLGDLLAAADAAAQAATAHAHHGQRAEQAAATTRAHHLAAACGGPHTPALSALTRPLPLTDREREIVTLAAAGLTNRQIAERLVVSVRTVEGHLYRAGAKLGTSDRTQLSALLRAD